MVDATEWKWLTARTYHGTHAILLTQATPKEIDRFCDRHEGAIFENRTTAPGRHWDGSRMTDADMRRYGAKL